MLDNFSYCFSHWENFNQVQCLNTINLKISLELDVSDFVFQLKEVDTETGKMMFSMFLYSEVMKIFTKPITHLFVATLDSNTSMKFPRRTLDILKCGKI